MYKTVTAACLNDALLPGAVILDVRTGSEHKGECLSCAHLHIPLDQLTPERLAQENVKKDSPVYLLCRGGTRARMAAETLQNTGYLDLHVIEGGLMACKACGVHTELSPQPVISLERQVRIAAGGLVLLGFILGIFVNPLFHFLSGFVGAGLIFAGVTDKCTMALLLSYAPWNRG